MIRNKTVSLADQVFERLESEILTGKYPRGSYLTEHLLCEDLEVSRTPVREALKRLEQERLIETNTKGIKVLSITKEDAVVIFTIRRQIEGLAARSCAETITQEQLASLKEVLDLTEFYASRHDSEKLKELDGTFHQQIYRYAHSPVFFDILMPLHKKIQKFRQIALAMEERVDVSCAEHRRIYEAIAAHDADEAEKAMTEHTQNAAKYLQQVIAMQEGENK